MIPCFIVTLYNKTTLTKGSYYFTWYTRYDSVRLCRTSSPNAFESTCKQAEIKTTPFRGSFHFTWYTRYDSNVRHLVPKTSALSTELRVRKVSGCNTEVIIAWDGVVGYTVCDGYPYKHPAQKLHNDEAWWSGSFYG